ncbi:MAG: alpha/beta hydrolase [Proteobacteria bacterium]|nr:alpha/beta hydrolase [Desulfobacula sp.]MBU4129438.1 alpha/beta hydrolase [Pseudomonadota bacterium]
MDFLLVHNRKVEVQWHGCGHTNTPTLVFLHEGLGSTCLWKEFPRMLSQRTQCNALVFSRLGYGRSDPVALPRKINFMHQEALEFLPAVLAAARIRDHIIIGHSDGGSIGIIYAGSRHATRLRGLITEAAHVFCEPLTVDGIRNAKHQYLHQDLKKRLEKYHGPNTETAFWGWNAAWLAPGFKHWNIEKYLKQIQVPLLAVQGRQDPYGTPAQLAAIASGVKDCKAHLIKHCRHAPHQEQQEVVLSLMAGFIQALLPPKTI